MPKYSEYRGHAPITRPEQLGAASSSGVIYVPHGHWKVGSEIRLPVGHRIILGPGVTMDGDSHTENVIQGNVDGPLLTYRGRL